jgi:drug/metabolite transporter (DMT)-like permease
MRAMSDTPARSGTMRVRLTARAGGDTGVGYFAVALVTILWGFGPLLVRSIDASPLTIAFLRNWIAVPVAVAIAWAARAPLTLRWLKAAVPGGVCFALAQTLGFASFQETSLANAVLIGAVSPVIIVIAAVPMFGERLARSQVWLMVVTMGAVVVFVVAASSTSGASTRGDVLALASLIAQTGYLLSIKQQRMAGVPAAAYLSGIFIVTGILITPLAVIWGSSITAFTGSDWIYVVTLAVVVGCIGHGMMTWASKHVNVGVASVMTLGTTVVSAAGGWVFFGQALSGVQILAGVVVLVTISAILVVQVRQAPSELVLPELTEPPIAE